jgi:hypothetical protein
MAQKITNNPDEDNLLGFYEPNPVPVEIKQAVSDIIAADPDLLTLA